MTLAAFLIISSSLSPSTHTVLQYFCYEVNAEAPLSFLLLFAANMKAAPMIIIAVTAVNVNVFLLISTWFCIVSAKLATISQLSKLTWKSWRVSVNVKIVAFYDKIVFV